MDCKLCVGGGSSSTTREVVVEPWGQNFAVPGEQLAEFVARDAVPGFYWHVVVSAPDVISVFAEGRVARLSCAFVASKCGRGDHRDRSTIMTEQRQALIRYGPRT